MRELTPSTLWTARAVALASDALQIGLFPFFAPGIASPLNIALDCVTAFVLWRLVGWHIAFLPSFIVEEVPVLNMAPTWTIAILIATRNAGRERDTIVVSNQATRQLPPQM